MSRADGRRRDQLRAVTIQRGFAGAAPGSVLIQSGRTVVLCTASLAPEVPSWLIGQGRGWITAEYNMLPGSTHPRKKRERGSSLDGRTSEIQRLIGRSLRSVANLAAWGERTITVDCDVLQADGGTRTLSITGGLVALVDAALATRIEVPLRESIAAVSAGIVHGEPVLDLDYAEDVAASVDMNVVMTASGRFVEIQGTGEEATFTSEELGELLSLSQLGIAQLVETQRQALGEDWPW
jgi:ribonuclease PH